MTMAVVNKVAVFETARVEAGKIEDNILIFEIVSGMFGGAFNHGGMVCRGNSLTNA